MVHFLFGHPPRPQVYYGILVLVQFAGEGIGQLISLLATDSRRGPDCSTGPRPGRGRRAY